MYIDQRHNIRYFACMYRVLMSIWYTLAIGASGSGSGSGSESVLEESKKHIFLNAENYC